MKSKRNPEEIKFMSHREILMRRNHKAQLYLATFVAFCIGWILGVFIMAGVR